MDSGAAALQIISRVFAPISAQYSHIMTNHSAVLRLISRSSPSEDIHTADKGATETISCIKIWRVGGSDGHVLGSQQSRILLQQKILLQQTPEEV